VSRSQFHLAGKSFANSSLKNCNLNRFDAKTFCQILAADSTEPAIQPRKLFLPAKPQHSVRIMTVQITSATTDTVTRLVTLARGGDQIALGHLFERFQPAVLAIIRRRVSDDADVQELAQDVFIKAMQKLDQLREPAAFPGWLRSIAVRHSINHLQRRRATVVTDTDLVGQSAGTGSAPVDGVLETERNQQLRDGLDSLGEIDRQTLVAFYLHGQSLIEMAEAFDAPVGTIKRRLHVARKRLAEKVGQLATV
jgi:RNA polymerase sigma-70 factor (ECF subfamily)